MLRIVLDEMEVGLELTGILELYTADEDLVDAGMDCVESGRPTSPLLLLRLLCVRFTFLSASSLILLGEVLPLLLLLSVPDPDRTFEASSMISGAELDLDGIAFLSLPFAVFGVAAATELGIARVPLLKVRVEVMDGELEALLLLRNASF